MGTFSVPLIIRGRVIECPDLEFMGRRAGTAFVTPDLTKHLQSLALQEPSALSDLYQLPFEGILDYLEDLGHHLELRNNRHLQAAFELSVQTSGLGRAILARCYETLGLLFKRDVMRMMVESTIGVRYLEGWVDGPASPGVRSAIRAFGARSVHVIAGNVPTVAALTIARNALTRGDAIVKTPSNDPLTAAAIARTMIDMAPDHSITRHLSVAYWKGGESRIEDVLYRPRNVEKIIAWGGLASISHIAKYIQPGIDLITLDPKLSMTIIGREAFAEEGITRKVARRVAMDVGAFNQEACVNARVVYIETGTHPAGLKAAEQFGTLVYEEIQALPLHLSGPAVSMSRTLDDEIETLRLASTDHTVIGGGICGAVIVSHGDEPVDFSNLLANRVANLVPVNDVDTAVSSVTAYTQTIGVWPDSLKQRLRERLTFHGGQRFVSTGYATRPSFSGPQDGIEPLRRMCKWIVDETTDPGPDPSDGM